MDANTKPQDTTQASTEASTQPQQMGPTQTVSQQPMPNADPPKSEGGNKMIFWLVGGLIVVILAVLGIYFFLNSQNKLKPTQTTSAPTQEVNGVSEDEVNSMNTSDLDGEFKGVDQDLQSL